MIQITSPDAPGAIGPYSQAIRSGNLLFVSGQLPLDPATGAFAAGDAAGQMAQCLKNIAAIAEAAGAGLGQVVKTTILLQDMADFAAVNEVYASFFTAPYPARACYAVAALPKAALVEVEAVVELG